MSASDVAICNLALGHIGHSTVISSLDEQSHAALRCRLVYAKCRDTLLETRDWSFARRFTALASGGDAPDYWEHSYVYPTDCLKIRWLFDKDFDRQKDSRVPYQVALDKDGLTRLVWTNLERAQARYTASVINASLFPASFRDALAYAVAKEIAYPLTTDHSIRSQIFQAYQLAMSKAAELDGNQAEEIYDDWDPSWIVARA
ncbi:MAG: hypothetical protein AAFX02_11200 [Pseudomonadota bacterium]